MSPQENRAYLNWFKPQRAYCCPCFFKDLFAARNVGIICHQRLINFIATNMNCECSKIFTVKKRQFMLNFLSRACRFAVSIFRSRI